MYLYKYLKGTLSTGRSVFIRPDAIDYLILDPGGKKWEIACAGGRILLDVVLDPASDTALASMFRSGKGSPRPRGEKFSPTAFETFYAAYPRQTNRARALAAWVALDPSPDLVATIMQAVERQKSWRQWRDGFIPHPATWLNGKRWLDKEPPRPAARDLADLAKHR